MPHTYTHYAYHIPYTYAKHCYTYHTCIHTMYTPHLHTHAYACLVYTPAHIPRAYISCVHMTHPCYTYVCTSYTHTHRFTCLVHHTHADSHTQTHTDTHTHSYTHSFRVPGLTHGRMDDSEAMDERVGGRCGWGEPGAGGAPLLQGPGAARGPADGSRALFSTDLQPLPFRPAPLRLRRPLGLVTAF